jgi:hypothetical protein
MLASVNRRAGVIAVVAGIGLAAAAFFIGRGTVDQGETQTASSTEAPPAKGVPGFAVLPTRKCHTEVGYPTPPAPLTATTHAAIPPSVASGLAAYRDSAGTTVIAPKGWECEASIGVDGGQTVVVFPPGESADPLQQPPEPGRVVALQLTPVCVSCIAEQACTLFPKAKIVRDALGIVDCPAKPLREQVTHVSPTTVLFLDPAGVQGSGVGSGGDQPSIGALSVSESLGARRISCTLEADQADACAGIISASLLAAP